MSAFGEWAAQVSAMADRMEASLAKDVAEAQAQDFLAVERIVTPKRTGRLAASETVDYVAGDGVTASAAVSPHTVYASFRNYGGTITAKNHPVLGTPAAGWFGKSVTQAGDHYVQRAQAAAAGILTQAAQAILDSYLGL